MAQILTFLFLKLANYNDLDDKAATPIRPDLVKHLGMESYNLTTGAICVYPNQVKSAVKWLKITGKEIPVASVATGFPAGQTPLRLRLEEIREAVADGATEIDIVINRTMVCTGHSTRFPKQHFYYSVV